MTESAPQPARFTATSTAVLVGVVAIAAASCGWWARSPEAVSIGLGLAAWWGASLVVAQRRVLPARIDAFVRPTAELGTVVDVVCEVHRRPGAKRALRGVRLSVGEDVVSLDPRAEADGRVLATIPLEPAERGVLKVGPVTATVGDVTGMFTRAVDDGRVTSLYVHPPVHPVRRPRRAGGPWAELGAGVGAGVAFEALRHYVPGDDPRRVDWRSTARTGRLIVREADREASDVTTVVLDDRAAAHAEAVLEVAFNLALRLVKRDGAVVVVGVDGRGGLRSGDPEEIRRWAAEWTPGLRRGLALPPCSPERLIVCRGPGPGEGPFGAALTLIVGERVSHRPTQHGTVVSGPDPTSVLRAW